MKLFLLTTKELGDFHVVGESFDDAVELLTKNLNNADYGFYCQRQVINVKVLSEEVQNNIHGKPYIKENGNLLIQK